MRLWTIHPQYLDSKGLVAAWREGLLAQKVLQGETRGYTRHPQLRRFQTQRAPLETIAGYLRGVANEAERRGYRFDRTRISVRTIGNGKVVETRGQLLFEWSHLKRKLKSRAPGNYRTCCKIDMPQAHPLFRIVAGPIRQWEKTASRRIKTNSDPSTARVRRATRNVSSRS
jgi:hypothetical protein